MRKKYKVLMVAPGEKTLGGITKVVSYYKSSNFWEENNVYWIETHCTGNSFQKIYYFLKGILEFIFLSKGAKIAHIHFTGKVSANRKFVFYILAKISGMKVISHIHSPDMDISSISNFAFKNMIKKSDEVIVLSTMWEKSLKKFFERNYIVLNNPSNGFIKGDSDKEKIILFAGKLEQRKGYMDLLNAILLIKDLLIDYKIIFAGNGEIDNAKKFTKENNMSNVEIKGWVDSNDIIEIFKKSEIFILPSYGEGFPMSIIDALSNKCAVIATPVGGIPDLLIDNYNCLFINPGDLDSISNSLEILVNDFELKNKLAINGYKLACEQFNLNSITEKLTGIYKKYII